MSKLDVTVQPERCQAHGACMKVTAAAFELDDRRKVRIVDPASVSDETILRAARSCPYRAIIVVDNETREQIHPRRQK